MAAIKKRLRIIPDTLNSPNTWKTEDKSFPKWYKFDLGKRRIPLRSFIVTPKLKYINRKIKTVTVEIYFSKGILTHILVTKKI